MTILLTHYSDECVEKRGQPCSDWCDGYDEGAKAQLRKALLGVGKKALKLDGTTYLVPDYKKYREALKEIE